MKRRSLSPLQRQDGSKRLASCNPDVPEAPHYDFKPLIDAETDLQQHCYRRKDGVLAVNFSSRAATRAITRAILKHHFNLKLNFPEGQLIPTIPNRVQYLQWAASLLHDPHRSVVALDIGTGPACIYPLLGTRLYPNWTFIATDCDSSAVEYARENCCLNSTKNIKVYTTEESGPIVSKQVAMNRPCLTICNPPFYSSLPDKDNLPGSICQLVTNGGEYEFLCKLAKESIHLSSVEWFTSLVGRKVNLPKIAQFLRSEEINAPHIKTVQLDPGGKTIRWAVAWSYGAANSYGNIVSKESDKWRVCLLIQPGRAYANQLKVKDILELSVSIFSELTWKTDEKKKTAMKRFLIGPPNSLFSSTVLEIHVNVSENLNEFVINIKTDQRGTMQPKDLYDLGSQVKQEIVAILTDCNT